MSDVVGAFKILIAANPDQAVGAFRDIVDSMNRASEATAKHGSEEEALQKILEDGYKAIALENSAIHKNVEAAKELTRCKKEAERAAKAWSLSEMLAAGTIAEAAAKTKLLKTRNEELAETYKTLKKIGSGVAAAINIGWDIVVASLTAVKDSVIWLGKSFGDLAASGGEYLEQRRQFEGYAASVGVSSKNIMRDIQDISSNTLSAEKSMALLGKALAAGFSEKEMKTVFSFVKKESELTGEGFDSLAERTVSAFAKGGRGISRFAKEFGVEGANTREIMEKMTEKMGSFADTGVHAGDVSASLANSFDNFYKSAGAAVNESKTFQDAISGLDKLMVNFNRNFDFEKITQWADVLSQSGVAAFRAIGFDAGKLESSIKSFFGTGAETAKAFFNSVATAASIMVAAIGPTIDFFLNRLYEVAFIANHMMGTKLRFGSGASEEAAKIYEEWRAATIDIQVKMWEWGDKIDLTSGFKKVLGAIKKEIAGFKFQGIGGDPQKEKAEQEQSIIERQAILEKAADEEKEFEKEKADNKKKIVKAGLDEQEKIRKQEDEDQREYTAKSYDDDISALKARQEKEIEILKNGYNEKKEQQADYEKDQMASYDRVQKAHLRSLENILSDEKKKFRREEEDKATAERRKLEETLAYIEDIKKGITYSYDPRSEAALELLKKADIPSISALSSGDAERKLKDFLENQKTLESRASDDRMQEFERAQEEEKSSLLEQEKADRDKVQKAFDDVEKLNQKEAMAAEKALKEKTAATIKGVEETKKQALKDLKRDQDAIAVPISKESKALQDLARIAQEKEQRMADKTGAAGKATFTMKILATGNRALDDLAKFLLEHYEIQADAEDVKVLAG